MASFEQVSFDQLVQRGLDTGDWDVRHLLQAPRPLLPPDDDEVPVVQSPENIEDTDNREAYLKALSGAYAVNHASESGLDSVLTD